MSMISKQQFDELVANTTRYLQDHSMQITRLERQASELNGRLARMEQQIAEITARLAKLEGV